MILTVPAQVAARAQALAPGLTARLLGVVSRALPDTDDTDTQPGHRAESAVTRSPATALGREAAEDLRQEKRT